MFTNLEAKVSKGQIVYSKCGRDKGKLYLVYDFDDSYAYLVDGHLRKLDKPKKKKLKHIMITNNVNEDMRESFENKSYLLDATVRKVLLSYLSK